MNIINVYAKVKELGQLREKGLNHPEHMRTIQRASRSRVANLPTSMRYFAATLLLSRLEQVDATALTEENILRTKEYLESQGKKEDTITNTSANLEFLAEVAQEMGVFIAKAPVIERAKKNQVCSKVAGKLAPRRARQYDRYAFKYKLWPERLREELPAIRDFYTNKYAEHRTRRVYRQESWDGWVGQAERFFGALVSMGVSIESLSFELYRDLELFKRYRHFTVERRGKDTMTAQGELFHIAGLVRNFYGDTETAEQMSKYISKIDFELTRSIDDLIERVSPDDCYRVLYGLASEAIHYEANIKRKYGRTDAEAVSAAHFHRAAAYGTTLLTVLRERNIAEATLENLFKVDGQWKYDFPAEGMKSGRPKRDVIVDLWDGKETEALVHFLLDKALELRPKLVARFKARRPLDPEPQKFFLNSRGEPFQRSGIRGMFYSASVRYAGYDKEFGPHALRKIIPTNLALRDGPEITQAIMSMLDHASFITTERFYVKTRNKYSTLLAKRRMEETKQQRDEQKYMVTEIQHISRVLAELKDTVSDPAAIDAAIRRVLNERTSGRNPGAA